MKKLFLLSTISIALSLSAFASKDAAKKAPAKTETFKVDTAASVAKWEGKKLGGAHQGELKFKSGELTTANGALTGGKFEIDMNSLKDLDVTDAESNTKLVNHLKSPDFFDVAKNPVSSFKITKVEKAGDKTTITGDLTIKGITHPVTFPADVKVAADKVSAQGKMTVDRTLYDIKFRSLKFFSNIGDKVIKDEFTVDADLKAIK